MACAWGINLQAMIARRCPSKAKVSMHGALQHGAQQGSASTGNTSTSERASMFGGRFWARRRSGEGPGASSHPARVVPEPSNLREGSSPVRLAGLPGALVGGMLGAASGVLGAAGGAVLGAASGVRGAAGGLPGLSAPSRAASTTHHGVYTLGEFLSILYVQSAVRGYLARHSVRLRVRRTQPEKEAEKLKVREREAARRAGAGRISNLLSHAQDAVASALPLRRRSSHADGSAHRRSSRVLGGSGAGRHDSKAAADGGSRMSGGRGLQLPGAMLLRDLAQGSARDMRANIAAPNAAPGSTLRRSSPERGAATVTAPSAALI